MHIWWFRCKVYRKYSVVVESGLASPLFFMAMGNRPGPDADMRQFFVVSRDLMAKRENYEKRTEELLAPIVEACGVSVYDVEYVKEGGEFYLRAYIDKPEGVNIGDCEAVSRALSDALDAEDFIEDAYILEVSSPGLGRVLKKDRHLEASIGMEVEIKLYKPLEKRKEFSGVLESFDDQAIVIKEDDSVVELKRSDIAVIRLALDF